MIPVAPIWHAVPPEVHSTLLTVGGTPGGIAAAGASWAHVAAEYGAAVGELSGILAYVKANYQGAAADRFVEAHQPMLLWMGDVVAKAGGASAAHANISAGYEAAVLSMPTMPELITNHVTHGILQATNFFGVNTVPIGLNEADYVRMWIQAADTMLGWDGVSTASADTIMETPTPKPTLLPGVGEASNIAATAASMLNLGQATAGGTSLNGADLMGTTLLTKKAATSPASVANKAPGSHTNSAGPGQQEELTGTESAAGFMQQASSLASSAPQAASSAAQSPASMLTQAPQTLAQAPQQLSGMLTQFAGSGAGNIARPDTGAYSVGFPGTAAIKGVNPAGLTSLSGGAFSSGPSRPLMPSTWGSTPAPSAGGASVRDVTPVATALSGAGASGTGAGGGMMGGGAHGQRSRRAQQQISTFTDESDTDETSDADGGTFVMTR